jgi:hypothetical protein
MSIISVNKDVYGDCFIWEFKDGDFFMGIKEKIFTRDVWR